MAASKKVIDLTRKKGFLGNVALTGQQLNEIPFLNEAWVSGDLKCCYLSDSSQNQISEDNYYFEIGLIKLPENIQYVKDTSDWQPEPFKTPLPIYSNILLNIQEAPQKVKSFHICENLPTGGLFARTDQGCSTFLRIPPVLNSNLKRTVADSSDLPILYYNGELYFSDDYREDSGYFLFPMSLSEGLVVYFVVKEDIDTQKHKVILNDIIKQLTANPGLGDNIGIMERMQLNDKLGIFVTRVIGAGDEALKHFPFQYDVVTLEKQP